MQNVEKSATLVSGGVNTTAYADVTQNTARASAIGSASEASRDYVRRFWLNVSQSENSRRCRSPDSTAVNGDTRNVYYVASRMAQTHRAVQGCG